LGGFAFMLALSLFLRNQLQRSGLAGRAGLWGNIGNVYFGIIVVYGMAYTFYCHLVGRGLSDQERSVGLANGDVDLDWLATWLSLLVIFGLFFSGELRSWSGWFLKGESKQWYGYLYIGLLALFGIAWYVSRLGRSAHNMSPTTSGGV